MHFFLLDPDGQRSERRRKKAVGLFHPRFCSSSRRFFFIAQSPNHQKQKQLRADVVPKTAENFRALCTGELIFYIKEERSLFFFRSLRLLLFLSIFLSLTHRYTRHPSFSTLFAQAKRASASPASPSTSRDRPSTASSPSEFFFALFSASSSKLDASFFFVNHSSSSFPRFFPCAAFFNVPPFDADRELTI